MEKAEEEARDKTFDEFMAMFENHLNGTAKPEERTKNRPNTANEHEEGKDAKPDKKKADDDDKKSVNSKFGSVKSGAAKSGKSSIKTASQKETVEEEPPKYVLPDNCKLKLESSLIVERMPKDYLLVSHPYPQIEGEMLLFQY
jgi:hypothetical protein